MKSIGKITALIVSIALLAGTIFAVFNLQEIIDWSRLRNYEPSSEISRLAREASFNDEGRKLFYVHDPELLDKPNFQGKCSTSEETIVLGCYLSQEKIYIVDVNDPRLEGIEQVTAAHEMLHAAYDRLSDSEKDTVNKLTLKYYEDSEDDRLSKTIESYRARDPSVVPNELHSILATEIRALPQELDDYYSQYFINRLAVVDLAEDYEEEFIKLENQIEAYKNQLNNIEPIINEKQNQLSILGSALEQEKQIIESLKSDPASFNEAIPSYNQKVEQYRFLANELEIIVSEYNSIVQKVNEIAAEEQGLIDAIDTRAVEI
jgi:hypothetical protein